MKHFILLISIHLCMGIAYSQTGNPNLALQLDGNDNRVCIGMGIIESPWTLEAWIKGDDKHWKESEVIIGGGEYGVLSYVDNSPLQIRNGKLHSPKADLWSDTVLDDEWHHVALSCDGSITSLFLDGKMVTQKDTTITILPGTIGTDNESETTFGGLIDEVRIWTTSLSEKAIQKWMSCPLYPSHPSFKNLIGYYPFDDGFGDMSANWMGKGILPYHAKNYRYDYKKHLPLGGTIINDNPRFIQASKQMEVFNAVVIDSEWDVDQGTQDEQVLKIRIAVTGTNKPLYLNELTLDLSLTDDLSDLSAIHVYNKGNKAKSDTKVELFGTGISPQQQMVLKASKDDAFELKPGINYILVTADIKESALFGNAIKIKVPSIQLSKKKYVPQPSTEIYEKQIKTNDSGNPNKLRVMQWNIWHGGVRMGNYGVNGVIDVIKTANPDIITMQEGYGSQEKIASSIGFHLQTPSPSDNLALFSRYPITKLPTSRTFFSNPGRIKLPDGRDILVNASWLRYAYRPEYTGSFPERNLDTDLWVKEDSTLALADITSILAEDINPVKDSETMPIIIAGDFNSGSHLDWTEGTSKYHYDYGSVNFPVSRFMLQQGYKDSFRKANPDEVERPEGTYSSLFGHIQHSRIDFIYYKGEGITAIHSKIIRTSPEIDYLWSSDHEAVLTDFELSPIE